MSARDPNPGEPGFRPGAVPKPPRGEPQHDPESGDSVFGQDGGPRTWVTVGKPPGQAEQTANNSTQQERGQAVNIPGYTIREELGRGGMGVVYKAVQVALNQTVAVKVVKIEDKSDKTVRERFVIEAQAAAAVRHKNVVQVYDFGEIDGHLYMIQEYVSGGSLADLLKTGLRLSAQDAVALVVKIARGVHAIHERRITHRDLKPGNILLGEMGEPKVVDFGLARRPDQQLTVTGQMLGTPSYMSPEQVGGKTKTIGPPTDVWALGVILYELLTGVRPFTADSFQGLFAQILMTKSPSLRSRDPDLPRELEVICARCLDRDPTRRFPTAEALANELNAWAVADELKARADRQDQAMRMGFWARLKSVTPMVVSVVSMVLLVLLLSAPPLEDPAAARARREEMARLESLIVRQEEVREKEFKEIDEKLQLLEKQSAMIRKSEQLLQTMMTLSNPKEKAKDPSSFRPVDTSINEIREALTELNAKLATIEMALKNLMGTVLKLNEKKN